MVDTKPQAHAWILNEKDCPFVIGASKFNHKISLFQRQKASNLHSKWYGDRQTIGPTDQRTNGPTNLRTNRPMDQRTNGPTDQRTNGPTDQRTNGPTDQRTNGPTDQPTDQTTNKVFYRGASMRLKTQCHHEKRSLFKTFWVTSKVNLYRKEWSDLEISWKNNRNELTFSLLS
jgi:hypothetical protein